MQQRIESLEAALLAVSMSIPTPEVRWIPFNVPRQWVFENPSSFVVLCTEDTHPTPPHTTVPLSQIQSSSVASQSPSLRDRDRNAPEVWTQASPREPTAPPLVQTALKGEDDRENASDQPSGSIYRFTAPMVFLGSAVAVFLVARSWYTVRRENASIRETNDSLLQRLRQVEYESQRVSQELEFARLALDHREAQLNSLVESMPDPIFTKDPLGRFKSANSATLRAYGQSSQQDLIGKTVFDLLPHSAATCHHEDDLKVITTGVPLHERMESFPIPSGAPRWHRTNRIPLRNSHGMVIGLMACSRDVTEQHHSLQSPQLGEQCLSRIFNSIPAIIAISTCADATYVEVNPAFVQALGYSREEVLGKRAVDLGVWGRPAQREEIITALQRGERAHEIECELLSKSGQTITVLTSVEPIHWNGRSCFLFCSRDITSLEHAHEEREKFVSLIRNSQDFIATADLGGKLTYLNPAGRRLIGIGEFEAIESISISDYLPELWREFHSGTVIPTVLKTGSWDGEMQFRNLTTHELIDVWRSIFLIVDPKTHEPICFASVTHNITERKRAEERIRQLNQSLELRVAARTAELEALNRELEAFAYSVSHDLRAPLRHIHGYIELLARATEGQRTDKASRYLKTITEASEEMARLIDDLLAFSRTGRVELMQIPMDLDEIAHEVSARFTSPANERPIRWTIHSNTLALGDPTLVRQVLANLFDNAIKYSRTRDLSEVEFGSAAPEGDHATLFVRDNGVGFDMQYVHKLFGVFERLHSATEFEGTGIGLATVRRIITRHGGRTWAESQLDRGATFFFTLRRATSPSSNSSTTSQP